MYTLKKMLRPRGGGGSNGLSVHVSQKCIFFGHLLLGIPENRDREECLQKMLQRKRKLPG